MKSAKKIGIAILSAAILFGAAPGSGVSYAAEGSKLAETKEILVVINGEPLQSDKPVLLEGRKRFVPLRAALEQLGWEVEWKPGLITISYRTENGSHTRYLHLKEEELIRTVNGTSYVEMYRLGGISNSDVSWSDPDSAIVITAEEEEEVEWPEGEDGEEQPELSGEESMNVNYGKYETSPTLDALTDIYFQLEQEGYDAWDVFGFYPGYHHSGYSNTPLDVVTFGWTGGDGEHFGFLTDFGAATNLEEAPIVMVSPMNFDQPAVVVANNIREFLRLAMIDPDLFYYDFKNEQEYLEMKAEYAAEGYTESEEELEEKRIVRERAEAELDLPAIRDPYTYSAKAREKRAGQIVVQTDDGLGVTAHHPSDAGRKHSRIQLDEYIGAKELKDFLDKATYASKLALIRDFHLHLEEYFYYEEGIEEAIVREMEKLGLHDELARMEANRFRG